MCLCLKMPFYLLCWASRYENRFLYFTASPQFTAKQSKKNILFCISLLGSKVRESTVVVLAYFPSRQTSSLTSSENLLIFHDEHPSRSFSGINFNLHAWMLWKVPRKYLCCETEIIKNYLWICMRAFSIFFQGLSFAGARFVLCAVDGPLFYSTDSTSIISHFSARKKEKCCFMSICSVDELIAIWLCFPAEMVECCSL